MARIGLALTGGLAPGEIVECVQLAEELGYESVWMEEGHGGDQFAILTACALATTRIRLGTAISSVFVRSVPTITMAGSHRRPSVTATLYFGARVEAYRHSGIALPIINPVTLSAGRDGKQDVMDAMRACAP